MNVVIDGAARAWYDREVDEDVMLRIHVPPPPAVAVFDVTALSRSAQYALLLVRTNSEVRGECSDCSYTDTADACVVCGARMVAIQAARFHGGVATFKAFTEDAPLTHAFAAVWVRFLGGHSRASLKAKVMYATTCTIQPVFVDIDTQVLTRAVHIRDGEQPWSVAIEPQIAAAEAIEFYEGLLVLKHKRAHKCVRVRNDVDAGAEAAEAAPKATLLTQWMTAASWKRLDALCEMPSPWDRAPLAPVEAHAALLALLSK